MTLNGERYEIVGVMPRGFQFPDPTVALWTPLADGSEYNTRGNYWLGVVGRLKPGVAASQAQAELDGVFRQLEQEETLFGGFGTRVIALHEATVGGVKTALLVLLAAVALVLLIACANVANLLLARATARQREIAIRTALGAGRGRLIRQLLTESLLLGLVGGGLGLLLAVWGIDVLVGLGPNVPRLAEIGIDRAVLGFTFALAIVTAIIFGLVPALQSSKTIERVKTLPGVQAAGVTSGLPLTNSGWGKLFTIEDRPAPKSLDEISNVQYRQVSPDYFTTLAIPILKGRSFSERDTRDSAPAAIINETFARGFFADADPIGKRLFLGPPEELAPPGILPPGFRFQRFTIVGVIGDVRHNGVNQPLAPEIYTLHEQELTAKFPNPSNSMYLAVRVAGEPSSLVGAIRREVQELDREQPIADIATMEELLATSLSQSRFSTLLLAVFAGVALILAAVGVYGVMAYSVEQRTHEIGIRVALGAQGSDVLGLVIRQGLMLAFAGVAIGLAAALIITRVMTSLLYEVTATDPLTFAIIPVLLTGVALGASFIPARRATKVDPMVALRYE